MRKMFVSGMAACAVALFPAVAIAAPAAAAPQLTSATQHQEMSAARHHTKAFDISLKPDAGHQMCMFISSGNPSQVFSSVPPSCYTQSSTANFVVNNRATGKVTVIFPLYQSHANGTVTVFDEIQMDLTVTRDRHKTHLNVDNIKDFEKKLSFSQTKDRRGNVHGTITAI